MRADPLLPQATAPVGLALATGLTDGPSRSRTSPSVRWLLGMAALAALAVRLGWQLAELGDAALATGWFWPAAGVVWAAAVRGRALGAATASVGLALGHGLSGQPWPLALVLAAGSGAVALATARWLRDQAFDRRLLRIRDLALAVGAAALGHAVASAAITTVALAVDGRIAAVALPLAALRAWEGEALGLLVLGLPLVHGLRRPDAGPPPLPASRAGGLPWRAGLPWLMLLAAVAFSVAGDRVFGDRTTGWEPLALLAPLLLLPWITVRAGLRSGLLALVATALAWWTATAVGLGPIAGWAAEGAQPLPLFSGGPQGWPLGQAAALPLAVPLHLSQGLPWLYALTTVLGLGVLIGHVQRAELARRETRWQLALEGSDLGVAEWDLRADTQSASARWLALMAEPDDEARSGHSAARSLPQFLDRVHPQDRPRVMAALAPGQDQTRVRAEVRLRLRDSWCWFDLQLSVAERTGAGQPLRVIATLADIGDRRSDQDHRELSTSVFEHLSDALVVTDAQFRILDVNPAYCQIAGRGRAGLIGQVPSLLEWPQPGAGAPPQWQLPAAWRATLAAQGHWAGDLHERRADGSARSLQVTISQIRRAGGELRYHVMVVSDVSEQTSQRERLERQAHFDELTQLPNRAHLALLMREAMAEAERDGLLLAVCYLDLDRFQKLNDAQGKLVGDRLLVGVAQRLRLALRNRGTHRADVAARLGGDEFVLLLHASSVEEARAAIDRVRLVVARPLDATPEASPTALTASIGATVFPLDANDADTLLRHAHHAMFGAKQSGRNAVVFFDPESNRRVRDREIAKARIQQALSQGELALYYQPKVDLRRGTVLGFEALLRWNHPDEGLLLPARFLPAIEQTELSARIGDHVLGLAIAQLARWRHDGLGLSVSVNISGRHLQRSDFAERLAELLARHPHPMGPQLELEVLETAALQDIGYTSTVLERCARLGVRWALDDFGTGFSTLTYLRQLPVQVLKIDRSFVQNMLTNAQDRAIIEGVLSLSGTFGCKTVAEGIETPAQARMLLDMGCEIGQGIGIAAAMPAEAVPGWVRNWRGLFALSTAAPEWPSEPAPDLQADRTGKGGQWPAPADPQA